MSDTATKRQLETELRRIGWGSRFESYSKHFESASRCGTCNDPSISIIVISWRFHPDTARSFRMLQEQRSNNFELIFVNNGAQESAFEDLKPHIDVYVRLNVNVGAWCGRNFGAVFARAPILFFLEDDGIPFPNVVEAHLAAFKKYNVIAVRGVYVAKTANPLNNLAAHYYLGDKSFPIYADVEGNTSYNAEYFYRAGGWEDQLFCGRGGVTLSRRLLELDSDKRKQIYFPEPRIYHDCAPDEEHVRKKLAWQARATAILRKRYKDYDEYFASWRPYQGRDDLLIERKLLL